MTKQRIVEQRSDITGCKRCGHYARTALFELCGHPQSEYTLVGEIERHTCNHMRQDYGLCGPEMRLRVLR